MKRIYDKSKLLFSLVCIGAYVISFPIADRISTAVGIQKVITAPLGIFLVLLMVCFLRNNNLTEEYGLCKFKGNYKEFLFFTPVIPILGLYLWNGVAWDGTIYEALLLTVSMLCVGIIEELLFRGFLFRTMCKDNVKVAILVSSVTFGLGHVVNLLNGRDLIPTLLQICYATALGFLLTMLCYKGKSLLPCMIIHGILNVISIFNVTMARTQSITSSAILCALSIAYALWIWKKAKHKKELLNE